MRPTLASVPSLDNRIVDRKELERLAGCAVPEAAEVLMAYWDDSSAMRVLILLFDSSIRSLVLSGACWLVLRLFRARSACVRHAIWTAVLLSMMAMPLLRIALPPIPIKVLPATGASFRSEALAPAGPEKLPDSVQVHRTDFSLTQNSTATPRPLWAMLILIFYAEVVAIPFARQGLGCYLAWETPASQAPPLVS